MPWGTWKPTSIRSVSSWVGTSTNVVIVETDKGRGYLKAMGNPRGEPALACELIGCSVAEWIGLTTPDFAVVPIEVGDEIYLEPDTATAGQRRLLASPGPAFVSREILYANQWSGDPQVLTTLSNPNNIAGLVVVDTWLGNGDRFPRRPADGRRLAQNLGNVLTGRKSAGARRSTLFAIDFSECLHRKDGGMRRTYDIGLVRDEGIYGLFEVFKPFVSPRHVQPYLDRMRRPTLRTDLAEILGRIPHPWCLDAPARHALCDFLCDRAAYLVEEFWRNLEALVPRIL